MISVAMATYNSEKYIVEQLDSIRKQTRPVDEVIIVDDCSKDDTVHILKSYIDSFGLHTWRIYQHTENKGFIKTFSEALLQTAGDVIILSDHDDVWMPRKTELIESSFAANPQILALATSFVEIDENGKTRPTKKYRGKANNGLIRRKIKRGALTKIELKDCAVYNISPGCTCALSGTLRNRYQETLNERDLPHDWKINILAACQNGLYYLDVVTTKYRIYSGNTYGLGHQSNLAKRIGLSESNLRQKYDMQQIIGRYGNDKDKRTAKKVVRVFEQRDQFMHNGKNLGALFQALIGSLQFSGLWESVVYDALVMFSKKES